GPEGRRGVPGRPPRVIGRFTILGLILGAQTLANIGPLGIPAIAKLIREDLGLTLTQAGSATWHSRRSPGWPGASSSACSRIARSADAVACRWRWRGSGRRSVRWPSP